MNSASVLSSVAAIRAASSSSRSVRLIFTCSVRLESLAAMTAGDGVLETPTGPRASGERRATGGNTRERCRCRPGHCALGNWAWCERRHGSGPDVLAQACQPLQAARLGLECAAGQPLDLQLPFVRGELSPLRNRSRADPKGISQGARFPAEVVDGFLFAHHWKLAHLIFSSKHP